MRTSRSSAVHAACIISEVNHRKRCTTHLGAKRRASTQLRHVRDPGSPRFVQKHFILVQLLGSEQSRSERDDVDEAEGREGRGGGRQGRREWSGGSDCNFDASSTRDLLQSSPRAKSFPSSRLRLARRPTPLSSRSSLFLPPLFLCMLTTSSRHSTSPTLIVSNTDGFLSPYNNPCPAAHCRFHGPRTPYSVLQRLRRIREITMSTTIVG